MISDLLRCDHRGMKADNVRYLYAYDRWATKRVLDALEGLGPEIWQRSNVIDERGLGAILVHQLGAAQRWRIAFESQGEKEGPSPEREALPTPDELRERWEDEWAATDAWLGPLSDEFVDATFDGVPVWTMLVHVVNHGTQHRSEAAALLSAEGHSPGELDLVHYAYELVENPS
jgi:uncharacterized damage-inducible protein DinB